MAMTRKGYLTIAFAALGGMCLFGLIHQSVRVYQVDRFNRAVAQGEYDRAVLRGSPYGAFVQAFLLQREQRFDEALRIYATIENVADETLRTAVRFNVANSHLQRALAAYANDEPDLATPLVELAKQSYRDLLRQDNRHWDAKYNLEVTLRLLPDVEAQESLAERNPERSPRAAGAVEIYQQLP